MRKGGDSWFRPFRKSFDNEHQLMLLGLNAVSASGLFTDMEKLADLMTKFGDPSVSS